MIKLQCKIGTTTVNAQLHIQGDSRIADNIGVGGRSQQKYL